MGVLKIQRDVAFPRPFGAQGLDQIGQIAEGVGEQQPPPPAFDHDIFRQLDMFPGMIGALEPGTQSRSIAPFEPVPPAVRVLCHGFAPQIP
jgi:hypothetical protein